MVPLFPFLRVNQGMMGDRPVKYIEPCAAAGQMVAHLKTEGHECVYACDKEPAAPWVKKRDVLIDRRPFPRADFIISNTPWRVDILHPMIELFAGQVDTWLLLYSDWAYTAQASPFKTICKKIVAIGRVKWIENSKSQGKENASWFLFSHDHERYGRETKFYFK